MKKLIELCIIAGLLMACQPSTPTPAPTPVVTETLADSAYLLQGIWYNPNWYLILSIGAPNSSSELTYSSYSNYGSNITYQIGGNAKFEDGKLTYLTDEGMCEKFPQVTYKPYIIKQDGFISGMRLELVGEDPCEARSMVESSDIWYYSGSATMPEGTERPPKTGGELVGIWFNQYQLLMNFTLGNIDLDTGNANFSITLHVPTLNPWFEAGTETAKYENGKLIWLTSESSCVGAAEATYEITMIVLNDKVIAMRPTVVGDDPCKDRKENFNNRIVRRVNP